MAPDSDALGLEQRLETLLEQERFTPPEGFVAAATLTDPAIYSEAAADSPAWWGERARELDWFEPFTKTLDDTAAPFYKWFEDGKLNASYNCLDRHVEAGLGDRVAYHWFGEEGEQREITYAQLLADVQRTANALKARGIGAGDVVGIYLPMIPEVVVAMLACARIGAPHNVVFGGFAPESVRERMEVSSAKALFVPDGARRKGKTAPIKAEVDAAMGELVELETIFVVRNTGIDTPMTEGRDVWLDEICAEVEAECPAEPLGAEHPLFILYSSGSTAKPKGILHTTGGYMTGVTWTFKAVFDIKPESDVWFCSADVGWITGHSYIVYGPLANAATSVMYEGAPDYPHKGIWWELIERSKTTIFYTAPTAIRACMKWGAEFPAKFDLSSLRLLGTVGEPINPKAWLWYWEVIGGGRCPIVDTWCRRRPATS
jgi:acetyl-CoA synthetase